MPQIEYNSCSRRPPISAFLWIGLALLLLGSGPLLGIIVAAHLGWTKDPNPNPIGPGILAMCTFWPAIGMIIAGAIMTFTRWRRARFK